MAGVVECFGAFMNVSGDGLLVTEYVEHGDLFRRAGEIGEPGPARENQALPLLLSLLDGVIALHRRGVAHGDVSLENALWRKGGNPEVVLVDFGMSVTGDIGDLSVVRGQRGKPSYQAPEMHKKPTYDVRLADLFACGVAAYALAVGGYPWSSTRSGACRAFDYAEEKGIQAFLKKRSIIAGGERRSVSDCLSCLYRNLMIPLLEFHPTWRSSGSRSVIAALEHMGLVPPNKVNDVFRQIMIGTARPP